MENTVFDILVYVFDRYMLEELPADTERETIARDLTRVGFGEAKVSRALDWLADLADTRAFVSLPASASAWRTYNTMELARIDAPCRGFLLSLEQGGMLSAGQREIVIDRLLALDTDELTLEQVKWVVMMVLSSQPSGGETQAPGATGGSSPGMTAPH